MRYKLFDQATRHLAIECARHLAAGRITVAEATSILMMLLRDNNDPRLREPLDIFVAADSDMDDLHLGARPYAAPAFKAELDCRLARFEESYRDEVRASAARIVSIFENPELTGRIARILREAWDPVGVGGLASGKDFYDEHVPPIRELLRVEATERELADHLLRIEDEVLKFPVDRQRAMTVARLLIESAAEFRVRLQVNIE
jgi:hypothetical protein